MQYLNFEMMKRYEIEKEVMSVRIGHASEVSWEYRKS